MAGSNCVATLHQTMTLLPDVIKNKIIWYALKCPHNLQEIKGKIRVWEHPAENINHILFECDESNHRVRISGRTIYQGRLDGLADFRTIRRRNALQTVWAIRRGGYGIPFAGKILPKSALKAMATANKIKGRSKLKTREDYVRAFLAL